jgi:hypothetical protein
MTVIRFPRARNVPPKPAVDGLLGELAEVEIELARARIEQIRLETRQARALWGWYCFKRAVVWGLVLWLLVTFARADSVSRSFYDGRGSFAGSSVRHGNSSSFYNERGGFAGSSVRIGNPTNFYDHQGRYVGSTITRGR